MITRVSDGASDNGDHDDEYDILQDEEEIEPSNRYEYDIISFFIVKGDTTANPEGPLYWLDKILNVCTHNSGVFCGIEIHWNQLFDTSQCLTSKYTPPYERGRQSL